MTNAAAMERLMPHCIFMPRREVERLVPESGTHLISISDDADDQASIDESPWSSVSYHHFVDAGFDEEIINLYGPEFELHYADYFLATKAEILRQRLKELADQRKNIVINCQAGRSRSAAVAIPPWVQAEQAHTGCQSVCLSNAGAGCFFA